MDKTFGKNPWEDRSREQELEQELMIEFNEGMEMEGEKGLSIESITIKDKNAPEDSVEGDFVTAAATILLLKIANKSGPKIFKKGIDSLMSLVKEKQIDTKKNIKIFGYETTYSIADLVSKWKDLGKFIWPKANWDSVNDTELDDKSVSITNTLLDQMKDLKLPEDQLDTIGGKITSFLITERSKNANAIDNVSLGASDIKDINDSLGKVDDLKLSQELKNEKKSEIAFAKLHEIIGRKIKTTLS